MISIREALEIHSILIERFEGSDGLRDSDLLESALGRPFQTFSNEELYPTPVEKAAAMMESIIKNHPFVDGNKRTGYVLGRLLLMNAGIDIHATQEEKYKFVIKISTGQIDFEEIKKWLNEKSW